MGLTVSCDLNYRSKLWKWGKKAGEVMPELVEYCDVAIGNEEDADKVLRHPRARHRRDLGGKVDAAKLPRTCAKSWPSASPASRPIAITLRGSLSASHNTWSGVLWDKGQFYSAPTLRHHPHRGPGGRRRLVHGRADLRPAHLPTTPSRPSNFAVAASCLKHTIFGDFNLVTVAEVRES